MTAVDSEHMHPAYIFPGLNAKARLAGNVRAVQFAFNNSHIGPPKGNVTVCLITEWGQKETISLPTKRGSLFLSLEELRKKVLDVFGWEACDIANCGSEQEIVDANGIVEAWHAYQETEAARRRDVLESLLESARLALASPDRELQYQACHALWELACSKSNYGYMTYSIFELLVNAVESADQRVYSLATAALWKIAEDTHTLSRMPLNRMIHVFMDRLFTNHRVQREPSHEEAIQAAAVAEANALRRGSILGSEVIVRSATTSTLNVHATEEATEEQQAACAVAGTGHALLELQTWQAYALIACTASHSGRKEFQRSDGALRVLSLLEATSEEVSKPLTEACGYLLAQAAQASMPVSRALLEGGAASLVRIACGLGNADWVARLHTSRVLMLCLARIRLDGAASAEQHLIDSIPHLIGELRAVLQVLLTTICNFVERAEKAADDPTMRNTLDLTRNITGSLWGLISTLKLTRCALPASGGYVTVITKLLEFAPECTSFANARAAGISKSDGKVYRNNALGIMASLGFHSSPCPQAPEADALRSAEHEAFEQLFSRIAAQGMVGFQVGEDEGDDDEAEMQNKRRSRRRGSIDATNGGGGMEVEFEAIYSNFSGHHLKAVRGLAEKLLVYLERAHARDQAVIRVVECYASALSAVAGLAARSLRGVTAIDRILAQVDQLRSTLPHDEQLVGTARRVHGHLMASILALVSYNHPAALVAVGSKFTDLSNLRMPSVARRPLSTPCAAHAVATCGQFDQAMQSVAQETKNLPLDGAQLEKIVAQMRLSLEAGTLGSAMLWLSACSGGSDILAESGGTNLLCGLLNTASLDGAFEDDHAVLATWVCIALWRMCSYSSVNAQVVVTHAASALFAAVTQGAHGRLRSAALGCINVLLTGGSDVVEQLCEAGGDRVLLQLAGSLDFRVRDRLTATRTLFEVEKVAEANHDSSCDTELCSSHSTTSTRVETSGDSQISQLPATSHATVDANSAARRTAMNELVISLLGDDSPRIRSISCRGIARAAQRGSADIRELVKLDAPRRVLDVLSAEVSNFLGPEHGMGSSKQSDLKDDASHLDGRATGRPHELLHDAMIATLNLSGARSAQAQIARYGIWALVDIWHACQRFNWTGITFTIGEMARDTLTNVSSHPSSAVRNLMYQAELKLKMAAISPASQYGSPTATKPMAERPPTSPGQEIGNRPATAEPPPEGEVADGSASIDSKQRYLNWLQTLEDKPEATADDGLNASMQVDVQLEPHRVLLARAAFSLMDANGDGELSRLEMVRAFRLDQRVRELLLPLLPMPAVSRNSITGVDLQEQIDAFEQLFKVMDADGSDGVSRHEFEIFFKLMDVQKSRDREGAAAARRRLMEPLRRGSKGHRHRQGNDHASTQDASSRWPHHRAGDNALQQSPVAPRLESLMRRNYTDTWRKPLADQLPLRPRSGVRPRAERQSSQPLSASLRPVVATTQQAASIPSLSRPMSTSKSQPNLVRLSPIRAECITPTRSPSKQPINSNAASSSSLTISNGPWNPNVSKVEFTKPTCATPSPATASVARDLRPFEAAYLAKDESERLAFKVSLPAREEYTPSFEFGSGLDATSENRGGPRLVSWIGVKGSRVGDSIAPSHMLPDGRICRLFHTGQKRNARVPHPEESECMPESLHSIALQSLPSSPPPPMPNERDVPKDSQAVRHSAPDPVKSMLDLTCPPPEYGEIVIEPFAVNVKAQVSVNDAAGDAPEATSVARRAPLVLEHSEFAPRRKHSDAQSFFTTSSVLARAFQIDWSRCNTPRFRTVIAKQDDGGLLTADIELAEIRDVLFEHHPLIYSTYSYYSALSDAHDGFAMCLDAFFNFLRTIQVLEEDSLYCNARCLESIFVAANIAESFNTSYEQRQLNRINGECALMRFEFIQCLVRIAIAKYVRPQIITDVSDAVSHFLENDVKPNLPPEATHNTNAFRRNRLYTPEVNAVLVKYKPALLTLFEYYAAVEGEQLQISKRARKPAMSTFEWIAMLEDASLLKKSESDPRPGRISRLQARLCLVWSQAFVSDELKRRQELTQATFVDFLEMLARLCTFVSLPTPEVLEKYGAKSAMEFYNAIDSGHHEGSVLLHDWREVDWRSEEVSTDSLAPDLTMLIELILDRLDDNGNGRVDRRDLERRRRKTQKEYAGLMLQHGALYAAQAERLAKRVQMGAKPKNGSLD